MALSPVLLLWPASVIFVAVIFFWIGVWWRGIHVHGKHEFVPQRRQGGTTATYREEDGFPEDLSGNEALDARAIDVGEVTDAETVPIEPPPARAGSHGWRGRDDDTEVLPRIQDIRPPIRATPIRRPPWL